MTTPLLAAADAPRERVPMDFGWRFHLGDAPDAGAKFDLAEVADLAKTRGGQVGVDVNADVAPDLGTGVSFVQPGFDDSHWRGLDLPHDWAIELPFDDKAEFNHGFKALGTNFVANNIGWYRREFELPAGDKGRTLWLDFDGIYRNALVWLNGYCVGRHLDGYGSFRYDISRFANFGGKNSLVVRVDASRVEGWFYEGAGIYRHVWLEKTSPLSVAPDGMFVWTEFKNNVPEGTGKIHVQATLTNRNDSPDANVRFEVIGPDGKSVGTADQSVKVNGSAVVESLFIMVPPGNAIMMPVPKGGAVVSHAPSLWSPESPRRYTLVTTVKQAGKTVDQVQTEFGIRTAAFDADKGFLLNGKPYTIKGTCNHQDHAGVGSALPDALQYFRVKKLKEMGSNAYRTSHNPPTPELLEACDRLGMLVMDENRRMDTNAATLNELSAFIRRDRNHPSVFIWSLGNEEPVLQGTNFGAAVCATMQDLVHQLDPTRLCTVAMNGKWGVGFSTVVDVQGFNYHTPNIDKYHREHPAQPEIGTETASTVGTRGIYADDKAAGYVSVYGDVHPGWGARPWEWWPYYATHPFASGGFVWTGFDYRGEPTPYKWPCINSHFGIMDTCGFPKDFYYYYQAWWGDRPVLHLAPHWNWPGAEGKTNLVRVFSNCKEVELFLNEKSLGRQPMKQYSYLDWNVVYQPGTLSAKGYDGDKPVIESKVETTGAPATIRLSSDRTDLDADNRDVSVVEVSVVDAQGRPVPTANNAIQFEISGPGRIIGVGNGDPSSHEPDQATGRKLFNGLAEVLVQSSREAGTIELKAVSTGLQGASAWFHSQVISTRPAAGLAATGN